MILLCPAQGSWASSLSWQIIFIIFVTSIEQLFRNQSDTEIVAMSKNVGLYQNYKHPGLGIVYPLRNIGCSVWKIGPQFWC